MDLIDVFSCYRLKQITDSYRLSYKFLLLKSWNLVLDKQVNYFIIQNNQDLYFFSCYLL